MLMFVFFIHDSHETALYGGGALLYRFSVIDILVGI